MSNQQTDAPHNSADHSAQESEQSVLEGHISVEAALRAGSRPIHAIFIQADKRNRHLHNLERMARAANVPVERVSDDAIEQYTQGQTHGGVIALAGPRSFVPMEALVADRRLPFVAMLDGIEDPFNFGYAVRALYAAGADGLVVRPRNWMSAAGTVARASAGASEWIPTAVAETAEDAAQQLRALGLSVVCTAKRKAVPLYQSDLAVPLFLVIGGEKRGITRSFLEQADLLVEIPYGRGYAQSLGTAAATAVLSFEIMRQRFDPASSPETP